MHLQHLFTQQHYTYLCSSVILIYAALYLFTQQHCLCSNLNISFAALIYAAVLYLFTQHYTYLRSNTAYAAISTYAAFIYTASYLFTRLHYTYISALLMQQYYTYLHSSDILISTILICTALLYLFYYNYSCSSNVYAAVLHQFKQQCYCSIIMLISLRTYIEAFKQLCHSLTCATVVCIITQPCDSLDSIMLQLLLTFIVTVTPLIALRPQLPWGLSI